MNSIMKRLCNPIVALCVLYGAGTAHADAVTDWNAIMEAAVAAPPTNPFFQARWGAIVQLAVFEAVNAVVGDYEPYLGTITAPPGASPDAAAIAAAYRTLVTLRPGSAPALDAAQAQSLSAIPDGPAKDAGIAVGEAAAAAMLLLRANDGSDLAASVPYTPGTEPGDWQPTPPLFAPALLPGWGLVTPFGLEEGSQFRGTAAAGTPLRQLCERLQRGQARRQDRQSFPPARSHRCRAFYAAATPVQVFNPAAREVGAAQGKTLSENARIFALLGMAMADGSIAVFDTKYFYNRWRPVTAIWYADLDDNRRTDPDPTWLPLIATPPFPSFSSAHATLSGTARAVLERAFGKHRLAITLTNPQLGLVLNYTSWKHITDDIDDARVYGGIHFRFDQEVGARQGRQVGKYILRNYLRSALDEDDCDDDE